MPKCKLKLSDMKGTTYQRLRKKKLDLLLSKVDLTKNLCQKASPEYIKYTFMGKIAILRPLKQFLCFFCHLGNFPTLMHVCQIKKKTSRDIYNILASCQNKKFLFGKLPKLKKEPISVSKKNYLWVTIGSNHILRHFR